MDGARYSSRGKGMALAGRDALGRNSRQNSGARSKTSELARSVRLMTTPAPSLSLSQWSYLLGMSRTHRVTIEHLHVELRLHNVLRIVVVDDGSSDKTWET